VIGDGEPKYLNSPETPLFSKGRELYGLYLARNAIREADRVLVVEGYMDVVALAQHGINYAVATLGTATTPVHSQKLFRLTDTVVFSFDGDAAGRKAAWRALENTLPVLADGKNALFLFLPDGEDPDDYVRKRGKAAFEALFDRATPLSEFLLGELSIQHPPTSAEGRAALVNAARPYLAQLTAPVLAALIRRRLAELTGLPEADLRDLMQSGDPMPRVRPSERASRPGSHGPGTRQAPSLVRELIQGLLLQPELARTEAVPEPDDGTAEGSALAALAQFCGAGEHPLTTAGVMQHFAGTRFERILTEALIGAEDRGISDEQAAEHLKAGVRRYWQQAKRAGRPVSGAADADATQLATPEETERLRQLDIVRHGAHGGPPPAHGNRS
jgi:DNA primase